MSKFDVNVAQAAGADSHHGSAVKRSNILAGLHDWLDAPGLKQTNAMPAGAQRTAVGGIPDIQPQLNAANNQEVVDRGVWALPESDLCAARAMAFMAKGVPSPIADALALRLGSRDQQVDDRRSCAECVSFHDGRCLQRREPFGGGGIEALHRCVGFQEAEQ